MQEDQTKQDDLVETTDCLEAVGVFRGWKNFFFVIVVACLVLLQTCFWLVDGGYVSAQDGNVIGKTDVPNEGEKQADEKEAVDGPNQPAEISPEPNQPEEAATEEQQQSGSSSTIGFKYLAWCVRFVNSVLILAAVLYCLTILFALKVSLLGRLGGINHISRAFFLSLLMVVLLLPWQLVFGNVVGVIYMPNELAGSCAAERCGIITVALYYLRFFGYWLLAMLLLIFSQLRTGRWTKATLRRLEVI
ncbi:MAG: hypothetical protein ACYS8I_07220 [Planctomycetota bacterium]|jgi:hypothetical protein